MVQLWLSSKWLVVPSMSQGCKYGVQVAAVRDLDMFGSTLSRHLHIWDASRCIEVGYTALV